jgi:hypothetical protein
VWDVLVFENYERCTLHTGGLADAALVRHSSFSHRLPPISKESGRKNCEALS